MPNRVEADLYESIPYPGHPFPASHPDRLATLAMLYGLDPAPLETCRVLELGCGDGGNIIPMAFGLPQASFLGIDLASGAIRQGCRLAERLGLRNLVLQAADLREWRPEGRFDYVIAHGLFSWVGPDVQKRVWEILQDCLAPQGVAYISYNTQPGGHLRQILRDMMLFHVRDLARPRERLSQARAFLEWLAAKGSPEARWGTALKAELDGMLERPEPYLFHDELTPDYLPLYFSDFVAAARAYGLEYLAEANYCEMFAARPLPGVEEALEAMSGDRVIREQYLDFVLGRHFRRTLLCRAEAPLRPAADPAVLRRLRIGSQARASSPQPEIDSPRAEEFKGPQGSVMMTGHPIAKAVLWEAASAWPAGLSFEELLQRVLGRLRPAPPADRAVEAISEVLLHGYAGGLVELSVHAPRMALEPGPLPCGSLLARIQIETETMATTLRHTSIGLEGPLERRLLLLLDGTRDRAALLKELQAYSATLPGGPSGITAEHLEVNLRKLARHGLVVA